MVSVSAMKFIAASTLKVSRSKYFMRNLLYHVQSWFSYSSHKCYPKRTVLVSSSDSIYENLALEEWMYDKVDLAENDYLLMWRNQPTIVFGRHQNPWVEANIQQAVKDDVDIARRFSGGGTVYHDAGNLNLSFLKARSRYNRRQNLDLVVKALTHRWNIDLLVNDRDDIMLDRIYKVSGTAAKLGRLQSYHHFTLLHDIDQQRLQQYLDSPMMGVSSKATKSFPATVRNLKETAPDMTFDLLVEVIGRYFLQEARQEVTDGNFLVVDPLNEKEYPGLDTIVNRLKSWDWIFGKTPKFSISRSFVGQGMNNKTVTIISTIQVEKGTIVSISVSSDESQIQDIIIVLNNFYAECAKGIKLIKHHVSELKASSENHLKSVKGNDNNESLNVGKWIIKSVDSCFHFL